MNKKTTSTNRIPPAEAREIMSAATLRKLNPFGHLVNPHQEEGLDRHHFWHQAKQTRRDPQIIACMQQRIMNAVALNAQILPYDESADAKQIADFVASNINRIDIDRITEQMLWSRFYGYGVAEILWQNKNDKVTIDAIKVRHPQYFHFGEDGKIYIRQNVSQKFVSQPLPERKFWHVSSGGITADNKTGEGLCEWLYPLVKMKNDSLQQWHLFLEKYASPTVVGKYPAARIRESEKQALLEAAANIRYDTAAVIPDTMNLDFIEPSRSGKGEYSPIIEYADRAIAKLILSQTMTTDNGSSYSQANVHDRVRARLVSADCDLISESFTKQVIRWLCDWNFGEDAPCPIMCRKEREVANDSKNNN